MVSSRTPPSFIFIWDLIQLARIASYQIIPAELEKIIFSVCISRTRKIHVRNIYLLRRNLSTIIDKKNQKILGDNALSINGLDYRISKGAYLTNIYTFSNGLCNFLYSSAANLSVMPAI